MNGEWIVLIWAFVSVIFLVKIPSVRESFAQLRKMSVIGIICMVLSLGFLANVSYTKDGVNTNQATSQTISLSAENSSRPDQPPILTRTGLPDFWKDDTTDTDGDGIPDLWEKWTHGKKLVADSDLDRDGDGLTDLEEFWNQTDPRTADTDGDGFNDFFEVANGMNPLVQADFTPVEPDTNNNGLPDIWEQAGYYGSFHDANGNGFDDIYEAYDFPAASDSNFDVLVGVYTSRSALLIWKSGEDWNSIVMLPTTGTSVKLRLPFGVDTEIKLLPAPYGTDPPSGELWKSRMRISFASRTGQNLHGNALVSSAGIIAHKIVGQASIITRFRDMEASMQMHSLNSEDGNWPRIELRYRQLGIKSIGAAWHFVDELIGPFSLINLAGTLPQSVSWDAKYGSVSSDGTTAFLTVTSVPPEDESVSITAISELDEATFVTNRLAIPRCARSAFGLVSATDNFSPHLGETASFTLTIPGCPHYYQEGWLEGELMRETTEGWQHVGWLDASQAQPGNQKRRQCLAGQQTIVWDGIATEGAALVDSPNVFTNSVSPFHRALPQVVSGEPVPPPYYTIFFRYREEDSDSAAIIAEVSTKVYVPQVVKIEMTDAAYNEFKTPITYPDTYWPNLLTTAVTNCVFYLGTNGTTKTTVLGDVLTKSQRRIPNTVNLIFTTNAVSGRYKIMSITTIGNYKETWKRGQHDGSISWRNSSPTGAASVYADSIAYWTAESLILHLSGVAHDESLCLGNHLPFTYDGLCESFAGTVVHETGHTLGLVNKTFMYGSSGSHNSKPKDVWIMNSGGVVDDVYRFGVFGKFPTWKPRNLLYLQFILPVSVGQ